MDPKPVLPSQSHTCSHLAEPGTEGKSSSSRRELGRDSPFPWGQVPRSSLADPGWFWDEHIQVKRARVETIVRGICLSPSPLVSQAGDSPCCPGKTRERKRKQSLPMQQGPLKPGSAGDRANRKGGPRVREQLHLLKQQLRHLQEHILQVAVPGATAQAGFEPGTGPLSLKQNNGCGPNPLVSTSDHHQGSCKDLSGTEKHRVSEIQHQSGEPRSLPSGSQALLEILKKELTRGVSQAMDSVLQRVLLDPSGHLTQQGRSFQELVPNVRGEPSSGVGAYKDPLVLATLLRRNQPQAEISLGNSSLAKPLGSPRYPISPRSVSYQGSPANCPLTVHSHIQENQILSQLLGHGPGGHWSKGPPQDCSPSHPSLESVLRPWVLGQQQCPQPFTTTLLESQPLVPSVKMEQSSLQAEMEARPFSSVHEGLNPGHLKKAKLMFFFTRYPSSNLLKAYFPDVQFNRCISSQMIKWFSNFREFYYIQMEKFARQAISDGVTNPKMLVVLRNSELFRVLNTHYNKGNDFEVPDCFLEIASLTLREFFRAVSTGKDSDPSWKKPIYKIISKLDSDIPEIFKSCSYPQELFQG